MGFFICDHRSFQRSLGYGNFGIEVDWEKSNEMAKAYKTNGFAILPGHAGYDEFYCINMRQRVSKAITFEELDSEATLTKIKNAFIKSGNNKKSTRKIMVRFAEIFASNKIK
jgi:hypothetical protein